MYRGRCFDVITWSVHDCHPGGAAGYLDAKKGLSEVKNDEDTHGKVAEVVDVLSRWWRSGRCAQGHNGGCMCQAPPAVETPGTNQTDEPTGEKKNNGKVDSKGKAIGLCDGMARGIEAAISRDFA